MKNLYNSLIKCTIALAMVFSAQFVSAQNSVDILWTAGSWDGEVGYEIIDASGNKVYCEQTGFPAPANGNVSLPFGVYQVYGFDSFGDGWNGGSINVVSGGVSLGIFTDPTNNTTNSCAGGLSAGADLIGTFALVDCEITCPADVVVDNTAGLCGGDVTIGAPTVTAGCSDLDILQVFTTGNVALQGAGSLVNTTGTILGATTVTGDVALNVTYDGDFGGSFEPFIMNGPDGTQLLADGNVTSTSDCLNRQVDLTIPAADWNNWVNNFGPDLDFTLLAAAAVNPAFCANNFFNVTASIVIGSVSYVNDYNDTADASDFYPVGTTSVTFTTGGGACSFNVTVNDTEGPTFDPCPADISVNLDPGLCSEVVTYEVDAFDNCGDLAVSGNQNLEWPTAVDFPFVCSNASPDEITYFRLLNTADLGLLVDGALESVDLGVWLMDQGSEMNIDVYQLPLGAAASFNNMTLLGSTTYVAPTTHNAEIINIPIGIDVPANARIAIGARATGTQFSGASVGFDLAGENGDTWVFGCAATFPPLSNDLVNLNQYTARGLIIQANFFAPGVVITQTDGSGLTSGDEFPVGTTVQEWTATDLNDFTSTCTFNITINEYANPTATMACNDNVEIALPESGTTTVGADMILEGGPYGCYDDYIIEIDGGDDVVDCTDVGETYAVLVTDIDTGNSCFGFINIVDNIDPVIECTDFAISCTYDIDQLEEGTVISSQAKLSLGAQPTYDNASEDFTFEVNAGASATVDLVTVDLDISHTWVSDLVVTLKSPDGTSAVLFAGACGTGDDVLATFADAGDPFACGGTPVISGTLQPQAPLADFIGQSASGTWTLSIADNFGADPTNINALGLNISYSATYSGPVVTEACDYDLTLETIEAAGDCSTDAGYLLRQYTATDASGNTASCFETITIVRPTLSDVTVPPSYDGMDADMLDCSGNGWDTNGNGYPDIEETGAPEIDGQTFENGSLCDISWTYEDVVIDICDGSYKVRRQWLVIDWCTAEEVEYNQLIKVMDTTGPDVTAPAQDLTIEITSGGVDCTGNIPIAPLAVNGDDCSNVDEGSFTTELWKADDAGDLTILEIIDGNGGLFVGYDLQEYNPATNNNASYVVRHVFHDSCGNETSILYGITVIDMVAPTAICDEITDVALNSSGEAVVFAETFDDGSYDNCNDIHLYAARMPFAGYPMAALNFYDAVEFDCSDVGASHMVVMLVLDFEPQDFYFLTDADGEQYLGGYNLSTDAFDGSWNACMVEVIVEDKLAPYLIVPGDDAISCDDYYTNIAPALDAGDGSILDDMFGTAIFGDNCDALDTYSYTYSVNQCGEGSIVRSWTVDDPSGNGPVSGTQTIDIFHVSDWSITFPGDLDATCEDGELPDFGYPTVSDDACEMIAISFADTQFDVVPDACYKIIREWSAINWCTYPQEEAVTSTQVIKVIDNEAPIFNVDDFTVEITEADCDTPVTLPTPDVTDCSDDITITTSSDLPAGEVGPGTYTANYTVSDGCGNYSYDVITITVVDAKKPTPYTTDHLVIDIMQTGMVGINVYDYDIGSFDNCSDVVLSFSPDVTDTDRVFTCDEVGINALEIWVTDESGNQDFVTVALEVQDNMNACGPGSLTVAGALATQNDEGIEDAMVDVNSGMFSQVTDATGSFAFDLPAGGDYSVVPSLDDEADNGVTTFDIVMITRHILGVQPLNTAYQMIAADANNSFTVTTLDVVAIRKVILQMETGFPNNTSWRFVDGNHVFADQMSPWGFPEVININNLADADLDVNFTGVKIGDVNGSAQANFMSPAENRTNNSIQINTDDQFVRAGQEVTVSFATNAEVSGYQFTLNHEGLDLVTIGEGLAKSENFGILDGALTSSWNDMELRNLSGEELFTVSFIANSDLQLSEVLSINSRYTSAEAYTAEGIEAVELSFNGKSASNFALYQNEPNPFNGSTKIGFEMAEAGTAKLSIMSVAGSTLRVIEGDFAQGYNEVLLKDLGTTGVLYYTLEADGFTATKKMIIIE